MQIDGVPQFVQHEDLLEAIQRLGFDPERVKSFSIDRWGIRATVYAVNPASGRKYVRDDESAVHVVEVPVVDEADRVARPSLDGERSTLGGQR